MDEKLVSIYLQDHMAGAVAGVELARRVRGANADGPYGEELAEICAEIERDREALSELMSAFGVRSNPIKESSAWVGEKLGRLKLNGRIAGYSPLSRLIEIGAGDERAVRIEVSMNNSAGVFQVDDLLATKLRGTPLEGHIEVIATIEGEAEKRLLPEFRIET